ncbi:hypothetical protein K469DRAFT_752988 [Zopfia rhizophila CBS 207.26]|uniref:Zn(2)-C6 fungal-type domain-containing protein n=1 Tax=Zopfia rhizophila CBS 207.26 TaxID=1314779 RepID=A0A6A6DNN5_9PEZI|nr:hypothetical protein K469DRAFT_752988 [Zopfia rhizophila CBS 207.26]
MASKDSGKGTRISLACIACRSRKHKCSGEKPRCAQCVSNCITCEWPTQQKRGPPKQYIHRLETRLFETETVLLALQFQVSAEQLQASFQQIPSLGQTHDASQYQADHEPEGLTGIRHDIRRPSYWSSFPMDSPDNVRRWWDDRTSEMSLRPLSSNTEEDLLMNEPPDADQHISALSIPEVVGPGDPRPPQSIDFAEQASETELMNAELRDSVSEVEFSSENTSGPGAQYGSNRRRVNEVENTTLASNEAGEGVLKLPSQFKLDFVW